MNRGIELIISYIAGTDSSLSIYGSSIYGKQYLGMGNIKPDKDSDIDCNLIWRKDNPLATLKEIVRVPSEGLELFLNKHVDVLVARGLFEDRRVLVQCMREGTYQDLCKIDYNPIIMYKQPRVTKRRKGEIKEGHLYNRFGYQGTVLRDTSRIIPLTNGNLIIYPNIPEYESNLFLTIFQRQILTQVPQVDKGNFLSEGINKLIEKLKRRYPKGGLLSFFEDQSSYWSIEFWSLMNQRLEGNQDG